jgi:hypothetical protein
VANFSTNTYAVTPSYTGSGSISPNTVQTVSAGSTYSFTITPSSGNKLASVGGTCGGAFTSGGIGVTTASVYRTNAVNANCTVVAAFAQNSSYTITLTASPSGSVTFSSSSIQVPAGGSTGRITMTAKAGYAFSGIGLASGNGSTCPAAGLPGSNTNGILVYAMQVGPVTGNCSFVIYMTPVYTVTTGASTGGTIQSTVVEWKDWPSVPVVPGGTTSFTITPNSGYRLASVGGTCGGSFTSGGVGATTASVYRTNAVNGNCTVVANFSG